MVNQIVLNMPASLRHGARESGDGGAHLQRAVVRLSPCEYHFAAMAYNAGIATRAACSQTGDEPSVYDGNSRNDWHQPTILPSAGQYRGVFDRDRDAPTDHTGEHCSHWSHSAKPVVAPKYRRACHGDAEHNRAIDDRGTKASRRRCDPRRD
jgi:hypothetical protein